MFIRYTHKQNALARTRIPANWSLLLNGISNNQYAWLDKLQTGSPFWMGARWGTAKSTEEIRWWVPTRELGKVSYLSLQFKKRNDFYSYIQITEESPNKIQWNQIKLGSPRCAPFALKNLVWPFERNTGQFIPRSIEWTNLKQGIQRHFVRMVPNLWIQIEWCACKMTPFPAEFASQIPLRTHPQN